MPILGEGCHWSVAITAGAGALQISGALLTRWPDIAQQADVHTERCCRKSTRQLFCLALLTCSWPFAADADALHRRRGKRTNPWRVRYFVAQASCTRNLSATGGINLSSGASTLHQAAGPVLSGVARDGIYRGLDPRPAAFRAEGARHDTCLERPMTSSTTSRAAQALTWIWRVGHVGQARWWAQICARAGEVRQ